WRRSSEYDSDAVCISTKLTVLSLRQLADGVLLCDRWRCGLQPNQKIRLAGASGLSTDQDVWSKQQPACLNRNCVPVRRVEGFISPEAIYRGSFCVGGTYSLGGAAPCPKKYCSICLTMTS